MYSCLRKDYPLVIRFVLSCPILCPDIYPHVYDATADCLSVMLSCLSCQKECTSKRWANRHWKFCISTRRVVTLRLWFHCFWVLVEFELYHHQYWGVMWILCPQTNTPRENVETPYTFQTSFLEAMLGALGRLSCPRLSRNSPRSLLHIAQTDRPRRICRLADYPQRDFGRPRWMALRPERRGSYDNCSPSAHTSHLSLCIPPVNGLLSQPVLAHAPPL